jgi:hypothetical protein
LLLATRHLAVLASCPQASSPLRDGGHAEAH